MDTLLKLLESKHSCTIKAQGNSMLPTLRANDTVFISKITKTGIKVDDIVLLKKGRKLLIHRLIYIKAGEYAITKGDNNTQADGKILPKQIIGKIYAYKRDGKIYQIDNLYRQQSHIYHNEVVKFIKYCHSKRIDIAFAKGYPIHLFYSKRYPLRIHFDCDILTTPANYNLLIQYFLDNGYFLNKKNSYYHSNLSAKAEMLTFSRNFSDFYITFYIYSELKSLIGLLGIGKRLYPKIARQKLQNLFLQKKYFRKYHDVIFPILSKENLIIYLCLDFFYHSFKEFYRLRTIYDVLSSIPSLDRKTTYEKISRIGENFDLQSVIYPCLLFLAKYYDFKLPSKFEISLRPAKKTLDYINRTLMRADITKSELEAVAKNTLLKNLFSLSPLAVPERLLIFTDLRFIYYALTALLKKNNDHRKYSS